jgi:predicted regulator of Ras-like GTPase activity (Roadblock/LC7/MglB family)
VCAAVLLGPDGRELSATGFLEGSIAHRPRGSEGFGYDPVFVPDGEQETVAELGDAWKAGHSHRARAVAALAARADRDRPRHCATVPAMEPAEALADLVEIATQIRAAVLVDGRGEVIASAGTDPVHAAQLAQGARSLLAAAAEAMGGSESRDRLVQLEAATSDGSVFVVQDDERLVTAVTHPDPTVGLVFYDLKTCLRHVAGESLAPKPPRRATKSSAPPPAETPPAEEAKEDDGAG